MVTSISAVCNLANNCNTILLLPGSKIHFEQIVEFVTSGTKVGRIKIVHNSNFITFTSLNHAQIASWPAMLAGKLW